MIGVVRARALIIGLVVVLAGGVFFGHVRRVEGTMLPKNGKVIVIDAGHGGRDGGVVGVVSGEKEADINLKIAKELRHYLLAYGYSVVMTRTNSEGLYSITSKNKKMSDMQKRKEIIEKAAPDLVVSIHQNFFPIKSVRGAQAFYAPSSKESREIADSVQGFLNASIEATDKTCAAGDYYILQCTEYKSILIECGFLSNYEDEQLLTTQKHQQLVAFVILSSIVANI